MFYQLPPVGNPVRLAACLDDSLPTFLSTVKTRFYASGTAALSAAVKAAMIDAGKPEGSTAEIILPAYGCPDLVSAVICAGAKPVLVDLQADRPWLDLTLLAAAINDNTVAIVGVNLFGIAERWSQLRALVEHTGVVLIEDSAQYFPSINRQMNWQGDLVVFSFGRGKPVSLLGGGAVYARKAGFYELLPEVQTAPANLKQQTLFPLKAKLYNAMISPRLYWLPQSLPFLHLGETRYHALRDIEAMDSVRKKLLAANVSRYQNDNKAIQSSDKISKILDSIAGLINLPVVCAASGSGSGESSGQQQSQRLESQSEQQPEPQYSGQRRMLRYPILVDAGVRDALFQKLKQAGLGASIMYPASLPEIKGLVPLFAGQEYPQARAFASTLITLPVHAGVRAKDVEKIAAVLESVLLP